MIHVIAHAFRFPLRRCPVSLFDKENCGETIAHETRSFESGSLDYVLSMLEAVCFMSTAFSVQRGLLIAQSVYHILPSSV